MTESYAATYCFGCEDDAVNGSLPKLSNKDMICQLEQCKIVN